MAMGREASERRPHHPYRPIGALTLRDLLVLLLVSRPISVRNIMQFQCLGRISRVLFWHHLKSSHLKFNANFRLLPHRTQGAGDFRSTSGSAARVKARLWRRSGCGPPCGIDQHHLFRFPSEQRHELMDARAVLRSPRRPCEARASSQDSRPREITEPVAETLFDGPRSSLGHKKRQIVCLRRRDGCGQNRQQRRGKRRPAVLVVRNDRATVGSPGFPSLVGRGRGAGVAKHARMPAIAGRGRSPRAMQSERF